MAGKTNTVGNPKKNPQQNNKRTRGLRSYNAKRQPFEVGVFLEFQGEFGGGNRSLEKHLKTTAHQ
jgi:hypothetical protein